jgi:Mrp family chromosome partitioning ATPase
VNISELSAELLVPPHEVITFYSYKGGTGRTMALANTACLLARQGSQGMRVLAIDWDLEAPGLHYYLPPAKEEAASPNPAGVVEFFTKLTELVDTVPLSEKDEDSRTSFVRELLPRDERG